MHSSLLRHFVRFLAAFPLLVLTIAVPPRRLPGQQDARDPSPTVHDREFFEARIRPVLVKHCYECHSAGSSQLQGGLRLDFREGALEGGDSGPAVVPGQPDESLLLDALRFESFEMPPAGKLPDDVIADFERWIRRGAADPRDHPPSAADSASESWQAQLAERRRWWSLQPPREADPPEVSDQAWSREPVDRFIRATLDRAGLTPAEPASAEVLLRRLAFVLTGLPPAADQVRAFPAVYAADPDRALEQLVDQLIASPHFGERFARHWMDVVRYTDTYGYEWDIPAKGSWEYRDYLIRAFNRDVGFDQLIREQIAGDLLPTPRMNDREGLNESLIGPMFYHMGEHRHGSSLAFNGIHQEMIDNKIDAFSKAFLGMTVACARCHDHKLDAISQADYYALAGMFMTPRWTSRSIDAPGKHAKQIAELKRLRSEIRQQLGRHWTSRLDSLGSGRALRQWAFDHRSAFPDPKLEDVAYPLTRLLRQASWLTPGIESANPADHDQRAAADQYATAAWRELADQWHAARQQRRVANEQHFVTLADFATPGFPDGWVFEGDGLKHGHVAEGTPRVSLDGDTLLAQFLPRGYHTHALSSKLPGAVRLPRPERFSRARVSLKLAGGEWSGRRDIPQNAFLNEGPVFFDPAAPFTWTTTGPTPLKNGVTRVLTEISTASLNANFPPRTGVARAGKERLPDDDEGRGKRSWFSITGIVAHDAPGAPADTLDAFQSLFDDGPRQDDASGEDEDEEKLTEEAVWQRLADWLRGTVERWAAGKTQPGDARVLNWMLQTQLLPNQASALPQVASLVSEYRRIEATIDFPRTVNSMDERGVEPVDYRLNVRGDVHDEGPAIPRGFLEVFAGQHEVGKSAGSGRLELARYLASRRNPQTARVYVNRVWQWVFGKGIVATPSDFGKLGAHPSHPELLDWLAIQFMEEGWSTKKLVKRLVLSRTFRQSGRVSPAAADRDPANRLWHHYPTRRLEAEAIRDSLLAVSGRLDAQLHGPPINPYRTAEDAKKRLFSGPLDGHGRRSLYLEMSIMDPPKFLVGFNLPDLKLPTGHRDQTNVPAQALIMLNHPFVVELAEQWAERLVEDGSGNPDERVRRMFARALGRQPEEREVRRWTEALTAFATTDNLLSDKGAWAELAHAMFNTKEFLYYR